MRRTSWSIPSAPGEAHPLSHNLHHITQSYALKAPPYVHKNAATRRRKVPCNSRESRTSSRIGQELKASASSGCGEGQPWLQ